MKSQLGLFHSLMSASAFALSMGFSGSASAAVLDTCTIDTLDPDASLTVTFGDARISTCGLGIGSNDSESIVSGLGGIAGWDFYGKYDIDGNEGFTLGWTAPGYSEEPTGTWEINPGAFDAGTQFLFVLKDGPATADNGRDSIQWVWFHITSFAALSGGDWSMYRGADNSHISLYTAGGGTPPFQIPEPGMLLLVGAGLVGLGLARRRKSA
jgi:hypothetical protein